MEWLESISRTIRKPFGRTFSRDQRTNVSLQLPAEVSRDSVSIGPFVKTEFPVECSECGSEGHYFHQYTDATGRFFTSQELRCHDCHTKVYGHREEIPMLTDDGVDTTRSLAFDSIDPKELFTDYYDGRDD